MTIIDTRSVFWGAVKCCIHERLVAFNGNVARIFVHEGLTEKFPQLTAVFPSENKYISRYR